MFFRRSASLSLHSRRWTSTTASGEPMEQIISKWKVASKYMLVFSGVVSAGIFTIIRARQQDDFYDRLPGPMQTVVNSAIGNWVIKQQHLVSSLCREKLLGQQPSTETDTSDGTSNVTRNDYSKQKLPQSAILSPMSEHALYLTVTLSDRTDFKLSAALAAKFAVERQGLRVPFALGFSERVWDKVQTNVPGGMTPEPFAYKTRHGSHGKLPATGGDIFLHVKAARKSDCYEIGQQLLKILPEGACVNAEDVYGFAYNPSSVGKRHNSSSTTCKTSKDLTGFSLHTANPKTQRCMQDAALIPTTGGSYLLTQHWVHNMTKFETLSDEEQEHVIGCRKARQSSDHGTQYLGTHDLEKNPGSLPFAVLDGLPANAHVARMIGADRHGKKLSILRQGMPCGELGTGNSERHRRGMYFAGYSRDPVILWYMLDRMVGIKIRDGAASSVPDKLMEYNKCIRGQCYYVPSVAQLGALSRLAVYKEPETGLLGIRWTTKHQKGVGSPVVVQQGTESV